MALPFMPFYWGDYWRDTAHLSDAEHVSYLRLISHYWQHGSLPTDDARLARIAGRSMADWMQMRPVISEFFQIDWRHKRIDRDLDKQGAAHEARVMGGKMTAAKRWAGSSATSSAYSNQNHNQNHIQILEPKPEPKSVSRARATRLPQDWQPSEKGWAFGESEGVDVSRELDKFRDYWLSKPKDNTKLDWEAAWRNWCRKAEKKAVTRHDKLMQWANSEEKSDVLSISQESGRDYHFSLPDPTRNTR
jgi:uncharacterized protein YdaU (DUF1376 family)